MTNISDEQLEEIQTVFKLKHNTNDDIDFEDIEKQYINYAINLTASIIIAQKHNNSLKENNLREWAEKIIKNYVILELCNNMSLDGLSSTAINTKISKEIDTEKLRFYTIFNEEKYIQSWEKEIQNNEEFKNFHNAEKRDYQFSENKKNEDWEEMKIVFYEHIYYSNHATITKEAMIYEYKKNNWLPNTNIEHCDKQTLIAIITNSIKEDLIYLNMFSEELLQKCISYGIVSPVSKIGELNRYKYEKDIGSFKSSDNLFDLYRGSFENAYNDKRLQIHIFIKFKEYFELIKSPSIEDLNQNISDQNNVDTNTPRIDPKIGPNIIPSEISVIHITITTVLLIITAVLSLFTINIWFKYKKIKNRKKI